MSTRVRRRDEDELRAAPHLAGSSVSDIRAACCGVWTRSPRGHARGPRSIGQGAFSIWLARRLLKAQD
jgi:hypothetical protein